MKNFDYEVVNAEGKLESCVICVFICFDIWNSHGIDLDVMEEGGDEVDGFKVIVAGSSGVFPVEFGTGVQVSGFQLIDVWHMNQFLPSSTFVFVSLLNLIFFMN